MLIERVLHTGRAARPVGRLLKWVRLGRGHVLTLLAMLHARQQGQSDAREAFRAVAETQHEHAARCLLHAFSLHRLGHVDERLEAREAGNRRQARTAAASAPARTLQQRAASCPRRPQPVPRRRRPPCGRRRRSSRHGRSRRGSPNSAFERLLGSRCRSMLPRRPSSVRHAPGRWRGISRCPRASPGRLFEVWFT